MEALGARESAPRFFPPLLACGCSTTFERIAAYCVAGSKCACLRTMHCLTSMRPLPVAFSRFDRRGSNKHRDLFLVVLREDVGDLCGVPVARALGVGFLALVAAAPLSSFSACRAAPCQYLLCRCSFSSSADRCFSLRSASAASAAARRTSGAARCDGRRSFGSGARHSACAGKTPLSHVTV